MKQGNLNIRCTEDYAVLYWDKPAAAPSGAEYTVSLNGEAIGRTDRTHFTIEGLSYGSAFRVDVVSGSYCIGSATLQFGREKRRIDITAAPYFCKGDGHILNTDNLQRAINDCGADDILYVPAGDFLTGALRLHSDLEIYLAKGAVLQGTTNIHDYSPRIPSRFEGTEMRCYSSLLNAGDMNHKTGPNCRNIIIRGRGTICGGGQELARKIIEDERARIKSFLDDNRELVESCENSDTIPGRVRPRLINLSNCENVWISGITLKNGPSWNVHMIYCDDIQTDHCTFVSEGVWNGDGWDPDSSTNCTLFASEFSTGDDAVAIKSGKNPEGNEINRPCAHIRVFDCRSDCGHGICIGSEMSGGVEDVQIWDCDLANSLSGIEIKATPKRGGYVRGVTVRDCITPRVMLHSVPYNDDGVPAGAPPKLEHCFFERLTLTAEVLDHDRSRHDAAPIEIAGFDKPGYEVEDIVFKDITITKPSVALPLVILRQLLHSSGVLPVRRVQLRFLPSSKIGSWCFPFCCLISKRFLDRCWNLMDLAQDSDELSQKNEALIHKTIKKVTADIDDLKMNTAIAALMAMVNEFYSSGLTRGDLQQLMLLLSPFAPHMVEEMWELTGYAGKTGKMAMQMPWPAYDEGKTVDTHVDMAIQVNGKLKGAVTVPAGSDQETVMAAAMELDKVRKATEGMTVVKTILVKDKLMNLIVKPAK